jgi:hypothetical protein
MTLQVYFFKHAIGSASRRRIEQIFHMLLQINKHDVLTGIAIQLCINRFATRIHNLVVSRPTLARHRKDDQLASHIMRKKKQNKAIQYMHNAIHYNDLFYSQPR